MSARLLLRIAAVLLLLFAVGHTVGFLIFRAPTAEGRAVLDAMNSVHFTAGGFTYSYGSFYLAFGLFITLFQLFAAWLAWVLSNWSSPLVRTIAWGLCALQIASIGLSVVSFSLPPTILALSTAACLAGAALKLPRD